MFCYILWLLMLSLFHSCSDLVLLLLLLFFSLLSFTGVLLYISSLRADVYYFLCFTRKRDLCVTPFLIVFQCPAVSPEFGDRALIGFLTVGIVRINTDWLSSRNTSDNLCGINSAWFSIDRSETCRLKHE